MMKLRKNLLPKRITDIVCTLLIGILLPIGLICDIFMVLPAVHEPGSFMYNFNIAMVIFMFFNFKSNLLLCIIADTSYNPKAMEAPPAESEEHKDWRHCEHCDCLTPPRSWHCKICDVCILKRDHHCLFTGCCIGHKNHRYFFIFLSYLFVGAIYALLYNCYYIFVINADLYFKPMTILIILFPFPLLLMGYWVALPLLILVLNLIVLLYSSIMMVLQVQHVWHGAVKAEKRIKNKYDNGLYENLRDVLGERMYLVWISPFSSSPLPHNGNSWKVSTTHQKEAEKK